MGLSRADQRRRILPPPGAAFYPRLFLVIPFVALSLILLHQYEKAHPGIAPGAGGAPASSSSSGPAPGLAPPPRSTLLGNPATAALAATLTQNTRGSSDPAAGIGGGSGGAARDDGDDGPGTAAAILPHGSTVDIDGREVPAAPPGVAESAVDYYMNLQGIQNLMGVVWVPAEGNAGARRHG